MSNEAQMQLHKEQETMNANATRLVILLSAFIHILLNVYAYMSEDPIIKIEMPIASAVTVVVVFAIFRFSKKH